MSKVKNSTAAPALIEQSDDPTSKPASTNSLDQQSDKTYYCACFDKPSG